MPVTVGLRSGVLTAREELARGRRRGQERHVAGVAGGTVAAELADLVDTIVLELYETALADLPAATRRALQGHVVLTPLGGYGRRDLAPYSDVDLLLLHAPQVKAAVEPLAKRLMQDLNDAGLDLGYSVRTPADACKSSLEDATIYTSLVEARFLAGSATFFGDFLRDFQHLSHRGQNKLIPLVEAARADERRQYAAAGHQLHPNVKRARGGLRGIQLLRWIGFARFGVAEPAALAQIGAITADEAAALARTHEFLLRLRHELHFHAGRAHDVLDRAEQVRLAPLYGFTGTAGLLPVEQFMRHFFQQTDEVRYIVANFVAAARPHPRMHQVFGPLVSRAVGRDYRTGPVHITATATGKAKLQSDLAEVVRLIELASSYGKRIDNPTWVAVRQAVPRLKGQVTGEVCRRFLALLDQPGPLGEMLRRLLDLGVLESIIPAFTHARWLLQFNDYHQFTVDEHSIRAVQCACDFAMQPGPLGRVYQQIQRKRLLHLALLMHDLGKGFEEEHSLVGRRIVLETAPKLGLSPEETDLVAWLVEKHLVMSNVAQWRDVDNEHEVAQFAYEVGSPERLQMLYVLTAADLDAVGPGVLNDWKVKLLTTLYDRTMAQLSGEESASRADETIAQRRAAVAAALPRGAVDEWYEAQIAALNSAALLRSPAAELVADLQRLRNLPDDRAVAWPRWIADQRVCEYAVGAHEAITPGVFHRLTGALSSQGLQILSAQINTLAHGLILDRFFVRDLDFSDEPPPERTAAVCQALVASLTTPADRPPTFRQVFVNEREQAQRAVTARPTRVRIDNQVSPRHTVVHVFTEDQIGLLYVITRTLFELGLSVATAIVGTHVTQVVDVFYVTNERGERITAADDIAQIEARLLGAIADLTVVSQHTPSRC